MSKADRRNQQSPGSAAYADPMTVMTERHPIHFPLRQVVANKTFSNFLTDAQMSLARRCRKIIAISANFEEIEQRLEEAGISFSMKVKRDPDSQLMKITGIGFSVNSGHRSLNVSASRIGVDFSGMKSHPKSLPSDFLDRHYAEHLEQTRSSLRRTRARKTFEKTVEAAFGGVRKPELRIMELLNAGIGVTYVQNQSSNSYGLFNHGDLLFTATDHGSFLESEMRPNVAGWRKFYMGIDEELVRSLAEEHGRIASEICEFPSL